MGGGGGVSILLFEVLSHIYNFLYCHRVTRAAKGMTPRMIFMVHQKARVDALFLRNS